MSTPDREPEPYDAILEALDDTRRSGMSTLDEIAARDEGGAERVGHQDNRCRWMTTSGRQCRMAWRFRRSATDSTLVCTRHRLTEGSDKT